MTLSELHVALLQAGIPADICHAAAEGMVRHSMVSCWTSSMTSGQVAKMLWLSTVCNDLATVETECLLVKEGRQLPTEDGQVDGDTVVSFLAAVVRNTRQASNVLTVCVDSASRQVEVKMRDSEPIEFSMPGNDGVQSFRDRLTIGGSFISRTALAYSNRVWLPFDQKTITHHVEQD